MPVVVDDDAIAIDHVALDSQYVVVDDGSITIDPVALDSQSVVVDDGAKTIDHVALDSQSNEACATDIIPVQETPAARKTTSSVSTTSTQQNTIDCSTRT